MESLEIKPLTWRDWQVKSPLRDSATTSGEQELLLAAGARYDPRQKRNAECVFSPLICSSLLKQRLGFHGNLAHG